MSWFRAGPALLAAAALSLGACATRPPADADAGGESFSGKLSVRTDAGARQPARAVAGDFDLRGSAQAGRLNLISPLGTLLAQARWSPTEVSLATPEGETRYGDLDALSQQALGERLPVAALFDWLRGRPWPDAPSVPLANDPGFEQLGWQVSLAQFGDGWVTARRAGPPAVTVRVRVDK